MRACGIIAEYNPFHLGHRYQLEKARTLSGADVMIVAMSGNFVQRGEPAIEHKWSRAEQALLNGADLVLEIPTLGACQSSDFFAEAGVGILAASGCDALSFGVEYASSDMLSEALEQWERVENNISEAEKSHTYARQFTDIAKTMLGERSSLSQVLDSPNQQLAFSYLKALKKVSYTMDIYPVIREGSHHNDDTFEKNQFASGTALRKQLLTVSNRRDILHQLPYLSVSSDHYSNHWENYWDLLVYQIERSSLEELRSIYQMEEGIEHRLKRLISQATSFTDFMTKLKNKRWSWARLQRLCLYLLLGISKKEMQQTRFLLPTEVVVLGFSLKGQSYLKAIKEKPTTFVTNYALETLKRQQQFDRIYDLKNPTLLRSAKQFKPIH